MSNVTSLALSFVFVGLVACTSSTEPETPASPAEAVGESAAALQLVACRPDDQRVSCFDGWASNGIRCQTSRTCEEGTVCRGADSRFGGGHCFYVQRDEPTRERPAACPRGTVNGSVLCAAGFDATVVSRAPHCETCEAGDDVARRCLAAGLDALRCRAILNDHREDGVSVAERCRAAGISPERCRHLLADDEPAREPADPNRPSR